MVPEGVVGSGVGVGGAAGDMVAASVPEGGGVGCAPDEAVGGCEGSPLNIEDGLPPVSNKRLMASGEIVAGLKFSPIIQGSKSRRSSSRASASA